MIGSSIFNRYAAVRDTIDREAEVNRKIHLLEFGRSGSIIVAYIGNNILIKVLNLQEEDSLNDFDLYRYAFAPLMPIYFDFDYTRGSNLRIPEPNHMI